MILNFETGLRLGMSVETLKRKARPFITELLQKNVWRHVQLLPVCRSGPKPSIFPYYTCDSLLVALWLQLFDDVTHGRLIRDRCDGCGKAVQARGSAGPVLQTQLSAQR